MAFNKFEGYTMFPKSKPWGYHPQSVENKIAEYERALGQVNDKLALQLQANTTLQAKIERLEGELRDMHYQMSTLELPEVEEAVEHMVLDNFRHFNHDDPDEALRQAPKVALRPKPVQSSGQMPELNIIGEDPVAFANDGSDTNDKFQILF